MPDPIPPLSSTTEFYRPIEVFVVQPPKRRYWLHALLLLATIFTTLVMGARMEFNFLNNRPPFYMGDNSLPVFPFIWALHSSHLWLGLPFSFTLMLILLAHEMGHYLYCLRYGVRATLPFFVPFPSLIGTLGAFIRIRAPIRSRMALFDIGIAGPIAGFIVATPVLLIGLARSTTLPAAFMKANPPDSYIQPGFPLLLDLSRFLLTKAGLAHNITGSSFGNVCLHPIAIAGWAGMLATALNLLPGGQLDGGHITYSLMPRAHKWITRLAAVALIPMGYYFWAGWLVWAVLLMLTGMRHPQVPEWPSIPAGRRWLALLALFILVLTFAPAPIAHSSLPEVIQGLRQQ